MKKITFTIFCLATLLSTPVAFAQCNKNEIFNNYGFYGTGGFPKNTELYGPYNTIEECNKDKEKYLKQEKHS